MNNERSACRSTIKKKDETILNVLAIVLICLFAFICVLPFYVIIISSFRSETSLITKGYGLLLKDFSTDAYELVFRDPNKILLAYRNTILNTVIGTFFRYCLRQ